MVWGWRVFFKIVGQKGNRGGGGKGWEMHRDRYKGHDETGTYEGNALDWERKVEWRLPRWICPPCWCRPLFGQKITDSPSGTDLNTHAWKPRSMNSPFECFNSFFLNSFLNSVSFRSLSLLTHSQWSGYIYRQPMSHSDSSQAESCFVTAANKLIEWR